MIELRHPSLTSLENVLKSLIKVSFLSSFSTDSKVEQLHIGLSIYFSIKSDKLDHVICFDTGTINVSTSFKNSSKLFQSKLDYVVNFFYEHPIIPDNKYLKDLINSEAQYIHIVEVFKIKDFKSPLENINLCNTLLDCIKSDYPNFDLTKIY